MTKHFHVSMFLALAGLFYGVSLEAKTYPCARENFGERCKFAPGGGFSPRCGANCAFATSTMEVAPNDCGATATIVDVNVALKLRHPRIGDVEANLVHPDGTRVPLLRRVGRTPDNVNGCFTRHAEFVLSDETTNSFPQCTEGNEALAGVLPSYNALSILKGKPRQGLWTLEMRDREASGDGFVESWSLQMPCSLPSVSVVATDDKGDFSGTNPLSVAVKRSGGTMSEPLTVALEYGGDLPRSIYSAPASVVMAANEAERLVEIVPGVADDVVAERSVTVKAGLGDYRTSSTAKLVVSTLPPKPGVVPPVTQPTTARGCGCKSAGDESLSGLLLALLLVARAFRRHAR